MICCFFCGNLLNKHYKWKANLSTIIEKDKTKHINSIMCWIFPKNFIDWFSYQIHAVDPMIRSPFGPYIFVFSTNLNRCMSQQKLVALTPVNMHAPPAKYFSQFFHRQPWLFILQINGNKLYQGTNLIWLHFSNRTKQFYIYVLSRRFNSKSALQNHRSGEMAYNR